MTETQDTENTKNTENTEDLYVVGVGASAGGLEALERFFQNMPVDSGMAFVVVQHLSPDYKSMMAEILSKHTRMKVLQAEDGLTVQPNCVYLIPRKKNLTIYRQTLHLTEKDHTRSLNLPIDIFLHSLAQDRGEKAIGIVLSGTGSDGTRGIRAIKEADGMVMVQDSQSAKFDSMPKSAMATGLVDYILPPEKMPVELLHYVQHPYIAKSVKTEIALKDEDTFSKILALLRSQTGVDFGDYKRNTVTRRVQRRMGINQIDKMTGYYNYLKQSPNEAEILYRELLIGVTKFFRDPETFDVLREKVFPRIFEQKTDRDVIRVWVAGCSTGEEAYSIAMLFAEYMEAHSVNSDIKIFATDIDRNAIEIAGNGVYPESIVADVNPERLQHFFIRKEDRYHVSRQLRQMVIFARHNLLSDPPFAKIDLVTCRNLMIYLQPKLQEKLLNFFHFSLKTNGFLFLGNSETIGDNTYLFSTVDSKSRIYQYKIEYRPSIKENMQVPVLNESDMPSLQGSSRYSGNRNSGRKKVSEYIASALVEEYLPPFMVVDEDQKVLHTGGDMAPYLQVPRGEMSFDLGKLLRNDFSGILRTAVHSVFKHGRKLMYNVHVRAEDGHRAHSVNLNISPLKLPGNQPRLVAVIFEEARGQEEKNVQSVDIQDNYSQHILDLEQDLQHTRESLQAAIEELETSNEELQATNEELLAANEELQSTNEELQSVNEELITVNAQYQRKIEELTDLNNDMSNLLNSNHIGTVFLDDDLRVKRFTPDVTNEIYLIESDIGRPIRQISHNLHYATLIEDVEKVLREGIPVEREVQNREGQKWYLLRVLPYRTAEENVEGIVITLVDITDRRHMEESRYLLAAIAESLEDAIIGKDLQGNILGWNRGAEKMFGYSREEVLGKSSEILIPKNLREESEQILRQVGEGTPLELWETLHLMKDGKELPVELSVFPIYDDNNKIVGISKIVRDISKVKRLQADLEQENSLNRLIMESSPVGITVVNPEGQLVFANRRAEELLGLEREELGQRLYNDQQWEHCDEDGAPTEPENYPFYRVTQARKPIYDMRVNLRKHGGEQILLSVNGVPMFDQQDNIENIVFTLSDVTHAREHAWREEAERLRAELNQLKAS